MMRRTFLILTTLFLLPMLLYSGDDPFSGWELFSKSPSSAKLLFWMNCRLREELGLKKCREGLAVEVPLFYGRYGVFVTLKKEGKVRGCFGAFNHNSPGIEDVLTDYLRGALRNDPRYDPVDISEVDGIEIVITIADHLRPVKDIDFVDISRFGILITDENQNQIVYVPSEIRSIEYLKKSLSGIKIMQLSAFRAVTIKHTR